MLRQLTVAAVASAVPMLVGGCGPRSPDNLVIVSWDTVRRDHLATYGYGRATAPELDALAVESVVFENAFAQDTNTAPSHGSMFTGLYPHQHGAVVNGVPLAAGIPTLAEILRDQGFRTGAFVSGFTMESEVSGLDRGFQVYDDEFEGIRRDGRETLDRALAWLEALGRDERYFLLLHLFDAHGPYLPSPEYAALFESEKPGRLLSNISKHHLLRDAAGRLILHENRYVDRYDAQIRYLDDLTAELLERVDRAGTAVVVVGDHGETLGERYHAMDHGGQVFDEQIRIPLILSSPGLLPRRVGGAVETVDLTPTLLDLLGILVPTEMSSKGSSLLPLLRGEGDGRRFVFSAARALSERYADRGYRLDPERQIHAIRSWRWKLIRYPSFAQDVLELYDLESDPFERSDVASRFEETRDALLGELERWWQDASPATTPSLEMDEETMNKLRALGYLGD